MIHKIITWNIQNQFLLLQRVMKSWLSQAKSRKDAAAANEKAIELEQGAAQAKEVLEQMEALKWVEKFDDFYWTNLLSTYILKLVKLHGIKNQNVDL